MVSIIIPVYNEEKYLAQCLDSIFQQTYHNIEVIVVNDGSTDKSKEIIKQYQEWYSNLIYLEQENQGLSVARNIALKHAKGEYVFYIDSDDYLEKYSINRLYNKIVESNSDLVICGHTEVYDDSMAGKDTEVKLNMDEMMIYSGEEVADMVLNFSFLGVVWNKMYRREHLIKQNLFFEEGRYTQDWYPIFIQIHKAINISFINESLYNYRIRATSTTNKKTTKNIDDYVYAAKNIIKYATENFPNKNSINKFRAITLDQTIGRYYRLYSNNPSKGYEFFKDSHYDNNISLYEVIITRNLSYRTKLNLILWRLRLYHVLFKFESILRENQ
jgi:glycosyltransferase involved in cell wall biosynthesis